MSLQIYAAPSGFFKSHVDTPRSNRQFGSLVVSLPCYHKGGQLIVRHAQNTHTFDWGIDVKGVSSSAIQWAAFYSDCEHKVLEVTEGYRITLTYNLYHVPGIGDLAGNSPTLDSKSLPLFHNVHQALKRNDFMYLGKIPRYYGRAKLLADFQKVAT
jgi:phospholipase C